jgi:probable phosphoglycerate mutase
MTVFHLLRHGEHGLQGRICAGRMPGIGLSERGRGEAAAAAGHLAGAGLAAIYASPLERTRETAAIVGAQLDLPVAIREELVELDFGEWTGLTFDAIRTDPRWQLWATQRSIAMIPGGESMRQVQRRVVETLIELHQHHGNASVLLVSHGDVIRTALAFALAMPLDLFNRIEVATGSLSTIRIDAGGFRVSAINERPAARH